MRKLNVSVKPLKGNMPTVPLITEPAVSDVKVPMCRSPIRCPHEIEVFPLSSPLWRHPKKRPVCTAHFEECPAIQPSSRAIAFGLPNILVATDILVTLDRGISRT